MRTALASPVVRRVAAIQVLVDVQFWFPLWLIYLLDIGIGLGTALVADAVFRVVTLAAEIPLGKVADRIGRRRSVLLVCVGNAVVFALIALIDGAASLFAVWVLWGVVWALSTGVVSSYLYEACRAWDIDPRGAFAVVRGTGAVGVLASLALAGYLYAVAPSAPFLLTGALALVAALVALGLAEPPKATPVVTGAPPRVRSVWSGDPQLRRVWALLVTLIAVGWSTRILFQPLALDLRLSAAATGWFYAAFAAAGFAGQVAQAWVPARSRGRWAAGCLCLVSVTSLATAAAPVVSPWVFLPVMGFAYALGTSVLELAIHERVPDLLRSTALAAAATASGLVIAVARPGLGWATEIVSVAGVFLFWGGSGLVVSAALALWSSRQDSPGTWPTPTSTPDLGSGA